MSYYISHDPLTNDAISVVWKHDGLFSFIPMDLMNTDYVNYLKWIDDGNTAPDWVPSEHDLPVVTPNG